MNKNLRSSVVKAAIAIAAFTTLINQTNIQQIDKINNNDNVFNTFNHQQQQIKDSKDDILSIAHENEKTIALEIANYNEEQLSQIGISEYKGSKYNYQSGQDSKYMTVNKSWASGNYDKIAKATIDVGEEYAKKLGISEQITTLEQKMKLGQWKNRVDEVKIDFKKLSNSNFIPTNIQLSQEIIKAKSIYQQNINPTNIVDKNIEKYGNTTHAYIRSAQQLSGHVMPYEQNSCAYTATQLLRTIDNNIEIDASTYTAQKQTVNSSRRVFNMDNDKDIQELENYLSSNPFSAVYGMDTALTQHQALNLQEAPHHAMTAIRNPYSGKFNLVQNNSYSTGFAGAGSVQIQEYDVAMEKLKHYKSVIVDNIGNYNIDKFDKEYKELGENLDDITYEKHYIANLKNAFHEKIKILKTTEQSKVRENVENFINQFYNGIKDESTNILLTTSNLIPRRRKKRKEKERQKKGKDINILNKENLPQERTTGNIFGKNSEDYKMSWETQEDYIKRINNEKVTQEAFSFINKVNVDYVDEKTGSYFKHRLNELARNELLSTPLSKVTEEDVVDIIKHEQNIQETEEKTSKQKNQEEEIVTKEPIKNKKQNKYTYTSPAPPKENVSYKRQKSIFPDKRMDHNIPHSKVIFSLIGLSSLSYSIMSNRRTIDASQYNSKI